MKNSNGSYQVDCDGEIITAYPRKKLKKIGDILVGDMVELSLQADRYMVERVAKRKNSLIRPAISNIDQIIMVLAPTPSIDYLLIDKLVINCIKQNIDCILCLNKIDISNSEFDKLTSQYKTVVKKVIKSSAIKDDINEIIDCLDGKFTCFAGQSAVGKSSLTNAILGRNDILVGDLSEKIQRGKNTTTSTEIYPLKHNTYIIDTPGFSLLDIFDINYDELDLYYPEYVDNAHNCKYHRCQHINEPACYIKQMVEKGLLPKERYERYVQLYNELKNKKKY